jgi:outer membrane lipoprotein-sorting protein
MRIGGAITLTCLPVLLAFPAAADSLPDVLARMDDAAASFRALSADVRSTEHTAVINEDEIDIGTMLLKRSKRDMRMLVEFTAPNHKSVAIDDRKLEIYLPKQQTIEVYDVSKYRALLEQFLLIGFGTSGKDLAAAYGIRLAGSDTIGGQTTKKLELIPKSAEVLNNLKKLELWIPESGVYPIQQKFYLPAGDYKLVTYTNVKMNPQLSDADLKLKVPKDVKRVYPQK